MTELSPDRPDSSALSQALLTALDLVSEAVLLVDASDWRICALNRPARAWLGLETGMLATTLPECITRESWQLFLTAARDVMAAKEMPQVTPVAKEAELESLSTTRLEFRLTAVALASCPMLLAVSRGPATRPASSPLPLDSADRDDLTGLSNRRALLNRFADGGGPAKPAGWLPPGCAVFFVDVDGFKAVNDAHGHLTGDRVLQLLAKRLASCLRPEDLVVRYGGDEFVVIVERLGQRREAAAVAQRMLRSLAETLEVEGAAHHVSASIGIAFSGVNGEPLEPLIAAADRAMYQAKAQGPSNYSFA